MIWHTATWRSDILGYLAVYLYLYFTAVLRSFGNSMFQAVAMLVSTILNAILDPIFIHFIGFHGAAIATLLSQVICLAFMLIYLKKKKLYLIYSHDDVFELYINGQQVVNTGLTWNNNVIYRYRKRWLKH